jgi:hypothetical protein
MGCASVSYLLYAMFKGQVPWLEGAVGYFAGLAVLYLISRAWYAMGLASRVSEWHLRIRCRTRRLARAVYAKGYAIQEEAVKRFKPDVVIGTLKLVVC